MYKLIFSMLLLATLTGCATAPAPLTLQQKPNTSGIGVSMKVTMGVFKYPSYNPRVVYFAKLNNLYEVTNGTLYRANYNNKEGIYLLNAEPGDYVMVAANVYIPPSGMTSPSMNYDIFFASDLIKKTHVHVISGQFAYAGTYEIDSTSGMGDIDSDQHYYANIIAPDSLDTSVSHYLALSFRGKYYTRTTTYKIDRDDTSKAIFMNKANLDLAGYTWTYTN